MDMLNFIFRLGVVFAIFGFLWFLVHLGLTLLRGRRKRSLTEAYLIKFVRYFFLVDVTVLFCLSHIDGELFVNKTIIAGLILLMYFLGKLQNAQFRKSFFKVQGSAGHALLEQFKPQFNVKAEALVIGLSLAVFGLLIIFPQYAANPISTWFYESIIDIEDTPVFGFIFKVIGFFFVLSIFMKLVHAFMAVLTGKVNKSHSPEDHDDNDRYDDYEELK